MKSYTAQAWYNLAENLYELIGRDVENVTDEDLPAAYPKLVVMYEFFRLVRGEAFHASRPAEVGEFQTKIYDMENDFAKKLAGLEAKLDPNDSKTKFYLDGMKKSFDLAYFKGNS
jgi:hypothetical protein